MYEKLRFLRAQMEYFSNFKRNIGGKSFPSKINLGHKGIKSIYRAAYEYWTAFSINMSQKKDGGLQTHA